MPVFRYKARDREGVLISGEIEAASADELRQGLFNEGMIPIDVVEVRLRLTPGKGIGSFMQRVKPEDILMFTRQFHTLFKAGVTVDKIFSSLARQARKDAMRNALLMIRADVASGASLAKAFSKHPRLFNELYVSMLAAGEEAGILDDVLGNLSDLLEKDFTIQKNIKGAVLYPKIVIVVLVCAVVFLMTFVVPKFVGFYGHYYAQLPLPTRILIAISDFFKSYWYIALGAVVAIYYGYKSYYKSKEGHYKIDQLRFKVPIFGDLNLKIANSRFAHILSALYRSGLTMPRSLEVVENVIGNVAFGREVQNVKEEIQRGASLSEALAHQNYFPMEIIEATAVGESAGSLSEMLSTMGGHYDFEVEHLIKNLTTLLEPVLLIFIFGMVALLALAIYLPVWNMSSVIGGKV